MYYFVKGNFKLISSVFVFLCLLSVAVQYLCGGVSQEAFFSSDALYLPVLFSDLFSADGSLSDWFLTPAPYFFPDYIVFLPAYFLGGEGAYGQILVFALLQASLTLLAIWLLARCVLDKNSFFVAVMVWVQLIWLALTSGGVFSLSLISAFHFGIFLASIFFVALWLRPETKHGSRGLIACAFMAGLTFLSTLSDSLFFVQVVAPFVAVSAFMAIIERRVNFNNGFLFFIIPASAGAGMLAYGHLVSHDMRYPLSLGVEKISTNLYEILRIFLAVIRGEPLYGVILFLYFGIVAISIFRMLRGGEVEAGVLRLVLFSFFAICAKLIVLVLVTNLPIGPRYLIPEFFWPAIIVFVVSFYYLNGRAIVLGFVYVSALLLLLTFKVYGAWFSGGVRGEYYPDELSCIDDALEFTGVRSGAAQYADAKYSKAFSRLDLNIAQYLDNLGEMHWITSGKYFRDRYDFLIVSENAGPPFKIPYEPLVRMNGSPEYSVKCGSKSVYVWGKDRLRLKKLAMPGDSYTWKACELPTAIGVEAAGCVVRKKDAALSGYLTYGPYEALPAGKYSIDISFMSSAGRNVQIGGWDAVLASSPDADLLGRGLLNGTAGNVEDVTGEFSLSSSQNNGVVEIRTQAREGVDLSVEYIRVTKVQ